MATTTNQGFPYPSLGDAANGPTAIQSLAQAVEKQVVMSFASAADRTTKVPAPVEGMLAYLRDVDTLSVWLGAAWQELAPASTWQTYVPVMSGVNWAIGNGVMTGRYCRTSGKTIHYRLRLTVGSTTVKGATNQLALGLPSASHADMHQFVRGTYLDVSAGVRGPLDGLIVAGQAAISMYLDGMGAAVTASAPITWATGDEIYLNGFYEEA